VWTEDVETARRFGSAMQALQQCEDLSDISSEIVFTEPPEQGDLNLQLVG
jgi:hypothetical protein